MTKIEMQYIGVCALLSRISQQRLHSEDEFQSSIECALNDFMDVIDDSQDRFRLTIENGKCILVPKWK